MNKLLALGIFDKMTTQEQIKDEIIKEFQSSEEEVSKYEYLIAYVDYGSYEGTGYILMRDKESGELYENHSGHCSCYGNEGQFSPEKANLVYLQSDKFSCYCYGDENTLIREYIKDLKNG